MLDGWLDEYDIWLQLYSSCVVCAAPVSRARVATPVGFFVDAAQNSLKRQRTVRPRADECLRHLCWHNLTKRWMNSDLVEEAGAPPFLGHFLRRCLRNAVL